jgi:G3E family GTPase
MAPTRTPVWLITGYLGAGKTTLLTRWLAEPALAQAALVVNEIGEVGLDDRLLARAVDSASLVANACICCTGLPGLEQALTDLWWDRLQRRRPTFDAVLIETTGLADPGPVVQAMAADDFLHERYQLAGVLVAVSATTAWSELVSRPEARAQVRRADLLVITKTDRADPAPLHQTLQTERPDAALAFSAQGSLTWAQVQGHLAQVRPAAGARAPQDAHGHEDGHHGLHEGHADHQGSSAHPHHHAHTAQAQFLPCPSGLSREALVRWAEGHRRPGLQRLKGVLQSADGHLFMAQWALGDEALAMVGFEGPVPRLGLTCIA